MSWLEALFLGIIQGLTEFLPISSDGHLSVFLTEAARWGGRISDPEANLFFVIMVHIGTLCAILVYYRAEIALGLKGFLGSTDVPSEFQRNSVIRAGLLAIVATLPAVPVGLVFKKLLEKAFETPTAAALGFLVTATVLLLVGRVRQGTKSLQEMTVLDAFLIGVAQAFAPLPGVSRSALTVSSALALGLEKSWAVNFSLMMAVPAILGGAVLEIPKFVKAGGDISGLGPILAATVVAGVVGYLAIVWLVKVVRSGKLWYFSAYLAVIAALVLVREWTYQGPKDGTNSTALARPAGRTPDRDRDGRTPARRPLDRPDAAGEAAGDSRPRATLGRSLAREGLDLG